MIRKLILVCCCAFTFNYAGAQIIRDTVRVTNHHKSQMAHILDTCANILRYTPKDIKNGHLSASYEIGFFKQTLKNKVLYGYDAFRCCNFTISKQPELQLGVSEFIYKNKILANKAFKYLKSKERYSLSEMIILFKTVQIGTSVFMILTETPSEPAMKNLFSVL